MLLSEDFLKEKVTDYILHSFEKDEFYVHVNGVIQWIHKPKKIFCGPEAMWHMLAIRKQLNCYKSELHGLLNANMPVNDETNEMLCTKVRVYSSAPAPTSLLSNQYQHWKQKLFEWRSCISYQTSCQQVKQTTQDVCLSVTVVPSLCNRFLCIVDFYNNNNSAHTIFRLFNKIPKVTVSLC
jgi:hypothetical protein